jgi:hypothetical protein
MSERRGLLTSTLLCFALGCGIVLVLSLLPVPAGAAALLPVRTHQKNKQAGNSEGANAGASFDGPQTHCAPEWGIMLSPDAGVGRNQLLDVAAISATDVWAVGTFLVWPYRPIIEHWDGIAWSSVPAPHFEGAAVLRAVTALSANDIWAAGYYDRGNQRWGTLALHWDGVAWNQVPTPNMGAGSNYLFGIGALSANDVWAVGSYCCVGYQVQTLTMHWDGIEWKTKASPNVGTTNNSLYSVKATGPNDAWAVGAYGAYDNRFVLIEHWDGKQWRVVGDPRPGVLLDVEALSSSNAWAVGYNPAAYPKQTLIMRWDGGSWAVVPGPSPGSEDNVLYGLVGLSHDDIWAVGTYRNFWSCQSSNCDRATADAGRAEQYGIDETLIVHWDGGRWTTVPSPNREWASSYLYAITASPSQSRELWAVGETLTYANFGSTFITRYASRLSFIDVQPTDYFYEPVRYMYCANIVSGYGDNTFRPYHNTTRGQLAKIVVLAEGWSLRNPPDATFVDVPVGSVFYQYVETAGAHGIIGGYPCGGLGEPCDPQRRPYFRPNNNVTRAQITKMVALAEGWELLNPPNPTFADVPPGSTYYRYVETAGAHGIIGGYPCGGLGEPCDPQRRPYFRPSNPATRGQIAKIVYEAVILGR